MNKFTFKMTGFLPMLLLCLLLSGCLGRSSPEVTYYSILSMEQLGDSQALADLSAINLGVGPVSIPESLKRSQIATRNSANQYRFDEYNRWAGVLEKDITTVLGDNLGDLLKVKNIGSFPWMQYFNPTYRVVVDIQRLDGELAGEAVLSARWVVAAADGKESLVSRKSIYRQPLEEASYEALIRAESQLIATLSREIAGEIISLR